MDLFKLVSEVCRKLAEEKLPLLKLAVMGCVVNGPAECEGKLAGGDAHATRGRIEVDLHKLMTDVRRKLAHKKLPPLKVAVMGCVVNGPGECEGADVAIFAGAGKGIIYVQGEQKQTVSEDRMLDALLAECHALAERVGRGQARLTGQDVQVRPPDLLPRKDGGKLPLPVVLSR